MAARTWASPSRSRRTPCRFRQRCLRSRAVRSDCRVQPRQGWRSTGRMPVGVEVVTFPSSLRRSPFADPHPSSLAPAACAIPSAPVITDLCTGRRLADGPSVVDRDFDRGDDQPDARRNEGVEQHAERVESRATRGHDGDHDERDDREQVAISSAAVTEIQSRPASTNSAVAGSAAVTTRQLRRDVVRISPRDGGRCLRTCSPITDENECANHVAIAVPRMTTAALRAEGGCFAFSALIATRAVIVP